MKNARAHCTSAWVMMGGAQVQVAGALLRSYKHREEDFVTCTKSNKKTTASAAPAGRGGGGRPCHPGAHGAKVAFLHMMRTNCRSRAQREPPPRFAHCLTHAQRRARAQAARHTWSTRHHSLDRLLRRSSAPYATYGLPYGVHFSSEVHEPSHLACSA